MVLRLAGIAIGAQYGLVQAMAGVVIAQLIATASIGVVGWIAFHRFPRAAPEPLGEHRRGILAFIAQSSAATGVLSLRGGLAPLLLGARHEHDADRASSRSRRRRRPGSRRSRRRRGWCC